MNKENKELVLSEMSRISYEGWQLWKDGKSEEEVREFLRKKLAIIAAAIPNLN